MSPMFSTACHQTNKMTSSAWTLYYMLTFACIFYEPTANDTIAYYVNLYILFQTGLNLVDSLALYKSHRSFVSSLDTLRLFLSYTYLFLCAPLCYHIGLFNLERAVNLLQTNVIVYSIFSWCFFLDFALDGKPKNNCSPPPYSV